jgi:hypothetical protein
MISQGGTEMTKPTADTRNEEQQNHSKPADLALDATANCELQVANKELSAMWGKGRQSS